MKTMDLTISEEHREAIMAGASHVAVEFAEFDEWSRGEIVCAGTEQECLDSYCPKLLLVHVGVNVRHAHEVWPSDDVRALLVDEKAVRK